MSDPGLTAVNGFSQSCLAVLIDISDDCNSDRACITKVFNVTATPVPSLDRFAERSH